MTSYVNKLANTVTNKTSILIGRENLAKLTNGLNKIIKSKYRDFMKHGNTVQLISKTSHMTLQVCRSQNDENRLILFANGQIGLEYLSSHWLIEIDPKNGHLKFKNSNNYLAFDQEVPCLLAEQLTLPKKKADQIRSRNEFRLHEILGSDEYFALESVYYPGRYIKILPDGSISVTRDKSEESSHFGIHCIHLFNQNITASISRNSFIQSQSSNSIIGASEAIPTSSLTASSSTNARNSSFESNEKQIENEQTIISEQASSSILPVADSSVSVPDTPPTYKNLFPQLPKF